MIKFVNAKINLGLQIVRRRKDGYHDLQTLFYPIGVYAGTPSNPVDFCDVLEVVPCQGKSNISAPGCGDCGGIQFDFVSESPYPKELNLVYKAAKMFYDRFPSALSSVICLDKHLPDGAGIGGGSADASFTLRMLNELNHGIADDADLAAMALSLGADCPFFLVNKPVYAEGVGERLEKVDLDLTGYWLVLFRPYVRISTKEAFARVSPRKSTFDLRGLPLFSIDTWRFLAHNDFEDSIFPQYPVLADIKKYIYSSGAIYASLTGSGSCLYGIYGSMDCARCAADQIGSLTTIQSSYLLQL